MRGRLFHLWPIIEKKLLLKLDFRGGYQAVEMFYRFWYFHFSFVFLFWFAKLMVLLISPLCFQYFFSVNNLVPGRNQFFDVPFFYLPCAVAESMCNASPCHGFNDSACVTLALCVIIAFLGMLNIC